MRCDWLVDATGRSAALARQHGAGRVQHDALVAFHARFAAGRAGDRDARTVIEAAPGGWWYTALVRAASGGGRGSPTRTWRTAPRCSPKPAS